MGRARRGQIPVSQYAINEPTLSPDGTRLAYATWEPTSTARSASSTSTPAATRPIDDQRVPDLPVAGPAVLARRDEDAGPPVHPEHDSVAGALLAVIGVRDGSDRDGTDHGESAAGQWILLPGRDEDPRDLPHDKHDLDVRREERQRPCGSVPCRQRSDLAAPGSLSRTTLSSWLADRAGHDGPVPRRARPNGLERTRPCRRLQHAKRPRQGSAVVLSADVSTKFGRTDRRMSNPEGTCSSRRLCLPNRPLPRTPTSRAGRPGSRSWRPTGRRGRSTADTSTDVAIVGAGIAGVATAFFTLRHDRRAGAAGRARPGRRAARPVATPASSRPTSSDPCTTSPSEFGAGHGGRGPASIRRRPRPARPDGRRDRRHRAASSGSPATWACSRLNHLQVHLRNNLLRREGGLRPGDVRGVRGRGVPRRDPGRVRRLYTVVPQARDPRAARDRRRPLPGRAVRPQGLRQQRRCSSSRCSPTSSGATPTGSGTWTAPTSSGSSSATNGVDAPRRRPRRDARRTSCCARTASSTTSSRTTAGEPIRLADDQRDRRDGRLHGGLRRGASRGRRRR